MRLQTQYLIFTIQLIKTFKVGFNMDLVNKILETQMELYGEHRYSPMVLKNMSEQELKNLLFDLEKELGKPRINYELKTKNKWY